MELYPYQEAAMPHLLEVLKSEHRLDLCAASTGFGKTYIALELIRRSNSSFAVLCPKAVLSQWRSSANTVGVIPKFILNPEKIRTGGQKHLLEKLSELNWNWTGLDDGDVLILDEVHRYGGMQSQLARMAANLCKKKIKVVGLSATLADGPLKMRFLLHQARMVPWNQFYTWAQSVGCYRDTAINGHPWRNPFTKQCRQIMTELNQKFFPAYGVRLRSEDIPEFPEVQNIVDLVTPSDQARKKIDEAYNELQEELKNPDRAKTDLTRLLRWRQRVEQEKLHVFKELVEDALADGYSVVASFNFTAPLFAFAEMTKAHSPALIFGSDPHGRPQTDDQREANIQKFQTNKSKLLLLTIQAGGVGLSLGDELGGAPRLAFHNLPLSTVDMVQLLGRIHRANSKTKSVNRIVLVDGVEIEKKVFAILNKKIGNLSALQDDDLDLEELIKE